MAPCPASATDSLCDLWIIQLSVPKLTVCAVRSAVLPTSTCKAFQVLCLKTTRTRNKALL